MKRTVFALILILPILWGGFQTRALAQTATTVQPAFSYKLVAWDDITKGKITFNTTTIDYGVFVSVENDASANMVITGTGAFLRSVYAPINLENLQANAGTSMGLAPFSRIFIRLNTTPCVLKSGILDQPIILRANFLVQIGQGQNAVTFPSYVEDIIYMPSNEDLIPSILQDVSNR